MEHTAHVTEHDDAKVFGFWVYLMTDLVIFAVLFATFVVFRDSTFGGPSSHELFSLPSVFAETLVLLVSSFTCSLGLYQVQRGHRNGAIFWFLLTFGLGLTFLGLELSEFAKFVDEGASWKRSAFLSSFFALVGTHGLHISAGLLWMLVTMIALACRGILASDVSRIMRLGYFWHFLDVVWLFIFTVVYAMGYLE